MTISINLRVADCLTAFSGTVSGRGIAASLIKAKAANPGLDVVAIVDGTSCTTASEAQAAIDAYRERPFTIEAVTAGHDVTEKRIEMLMRAIELGADIDTVETLRDADRISAKDSITLPFGRYEHCSRSKSWARLGKGDSVVWGERVDGGYAVSTPGSWTVGSSDGFNRKTTTSWRVRQIAVGSETWWTAD
jgi:hypothetical protein